jgi:uncharacterized protein (TIGR02266 family)
MAMSDGGRQLNAARPAQAAREMLGQALGRIQGIDRPQLDVGDVTTSIANAMRALSEVQTSEPGAPVHTAGVCQAMGFLRTALEQMQDVGGEDPALTDATKTIARTLATLYPISKVQERQSRLPGAPAATIRGETPPDPRRTAQRFSIDTDIGFQSESNFYTGFTEDISEGGLFLATFDCRPIGSVLFINFTLPNGELVSAEGIVRWIREFNQSTPDTTPGMGVQFTSLAEGHRAAINRFLTQREPMFYEA